MIVERGAVHDACNYALWVVEENGVWRYFTVAWEPILAGRCPRCDRRLTRRGLRLLNRPLVRGTTER